MHEHLSGKVSAPPSGHPYIKQTLTFTLVEVQKRERERERERGEREQRDRKERGEEREEREREEREANNGEQLLSGRETVPLLLYVGVAH